MKKNITSSKKKQAFHFEIENVSNPSYIGRRVTRNQYNKELAEAVTRIEKGKFVKHKDALEELSGM